MSQSPKHIRVFISSPGDVAEERAIALKVLDQMPYTPTLRGKITIEVVAWDKPGGDSPMLATMTPQEAINRNLPTPSDCDIVVVMLWSRIGTPLAYPEYQKPDGERYLSGTEWEYLDAYQMAQKTGKPILIVYRRTEPVALFPHDPDFMQKYEQWQHVDNFFKRFINLDGSFRQGFNQYSTPDDFAQKLESHIMLLILRILETNAVQEMSKNSTPVTLWQGSPFPGLRAFTTADAPIFFGRERDLEALLKRLASQKALLIAGASGSGKSSLVGAGLIPRLKENVLVGSKDWFLPWWDADTKSWQGLRFTPTEQGSPLSALSAKLAPLLQKDPDALAQELSEDPQQIDHFLLELLQDKPMWARVFIFIDQFEEMFTLVGEIERRVFTQILRHLIASDSVRLAITLRADFLYNWVNTPELVEILGAEAYLLSMPKTTEFVEMIQRPAERAGLKLDAGLAPQMLQDGANQPGPLALLAYTLDELYQLSAETKHLTIDAYEALGGIQGAIGKRAENVFRTLSSEVQQQFPRVFHQLVSVDEKGTPVKRRVWLSDITQTPYAKDLIAALTAARLLVQGGDNTSQGVTVELAHEALLQSWRRLKDWVTLTQDDLRLLQQVRLAAQEWQASGQSPAFLWSDERLTHVNRMIERLEPQLDSFVIAFVFPEYERLLEELQNTTHQRRLTIGERLAVIGDQRAGVGLTAQGLPDISWCYVEGGRIRLETEEAARVFDVAPFYIAKYMVTSSQFQAFIDAPDGYMNPHWWDGTAPSKRSVYPPLMENFPREYVNWFEASAFCRWLTNKLTFPADFLVQNPVIRLPTEWEWQFAAGSAARLRYPWGNLWADVCCNSKGSGLNRTTAVGMYPSGVSPAGVYDMSGNLWEWCWNEYDTLQQTAHLENARAIRGGSWDDDKTALAVTHRNWAYPISQSNLIGFRLCAVGG
jgi:formylglycine-generating enzyme required for sulfatase activity/energy-coupling factor transporter ATP-binding protein EcfA2